MKNEVSPTVIIAVVVVAVILLAFAGWKIIGPGAKNSGANPYQSGPQSGAPQISGGPGPGRGMPTGPGGAPGSGG